MNVRPLLPDCCSVGLIAGFLTLAAGQAGAQTAEEPGRLFAGRRAAVVARFDADGDGRLSEKEREQVRLARKGASARGRINRGGVAQIPPEVVAFYDQDKDGKLSEEESNSATDGMRSRFEHAQKEYDEDGDGNLSETERTRLADDIGAGKIAGVPRFYGTFARRAPAGEPGRGTGRGGSGGRRGGPAWGGPFGGFEGAPASPLKRFDLDADGRLNAAERDAARQAGVGR